MIIQIVFYDGDARSENKLRVERDKKPVFWLLILWTFIKSIICDLQFACSAKKPHNRPPPPRLRNMEVQRQRQLVSFGICVCVPCSVHLARRVLQLERLNTSLAKELEKHKSQTGQISEEVNAVSTGTSARGAFHNLLPLHVIIGRPLTKPHLLVIYGLSGNFLLDEIAVTIWVQEVEHFHNKVGF